MSTLVLNFPDLIDTLQLGSEESLFFDTELGLIEHSEAEFDEDAESDTSSSEDLLSTRSRYFVLSVQDSRDEYTDMCDFAECVREYDIRLAKTMQIALDGQGAFRRFKAILSSTEGQPFRNWWYNYRNLRAQERLIGWLRIHEIAFDEQNSVYVKAILPSTMHSLPDVTIQELTLALIYLTCDTKNIQDGGSSWKGYEWSALDALKERGWIHFENRNKSLNLTQAGACEAETLLPKYGIPARR
jgi:Domain of unknown function (DUF6429)/Uncharacterised protein family (UPF0158)